jgi:serine/threonine protein phosphatase PrpC
MIADFAVRSIAGRRSANEDSVLAVPDLGLFAVADGMGGYAGGAVASRVAVETMGLELARMTCDPDATWPHRAAAGLGHAENLLSGAVRAAHREIRVRRVGELANMGSTVVALLLDGDEGIVAHVGDSRAYRLRGGALEQLTRDHSLVAELEGYGLDVGPKRVHPLGHIVTRALGMEGEIVPDLHRGRVAAGDTYLLCSDGVIETLGAAELLKLLVAAPSVAAAAHALVSAAYDAGGRDNISAVVVRL